MNEKLEYLVSALKGLKYKEGTSFVVIGDTVHLFINEINLLPALRLLVNNAKVCTGCHKDAALLTKKCISFYID